ncbi:MAG: hypothetical protein ACRD68_16880, partial [Pyrinomonadaceae bacterium]
MALTKTTSEHHAGRAARRPFRGAGGWRFSAAAVLVLCALTASAFQTLQQPGGPQERGARGAGVAPKRPATGAAKSHGGANKARPNGAAGAKSGAGFGALDNVQEALVESVSPVLATADFDLVGLAITAGPATQTVPKNTPTAVLAELQVPEGGDAAEIIAGLDPDYRVRGELSGPSLAAPLTIEAPIGQPLMLPPLARAGEHALQNLRVVDTGAEGEPVVAPVTPDSCGVVVIERLLVSEVRVNELSYEQIAQAGINLTGESYSAFNFTLGLAAESGAHFIDIPVAFPPAGAPDPRPLVGTPNINAPGVDAPTVVPVMLRAVETGEEGGGTPPLGFVEGEVSIPG